MIMILIGSGHICIVYPFGPFGTICTMICALSIFAQRKSVEVTGTIVDAEGVPLIGATVIVKEKPGLGVASDIDGNYKIKLEPFQYLVFSYIGYETQEHLVKDEDRILDITMLESKATALDEVTITGMGP